MNRTSRARGAVLARRKSGKQPAGHCYLQSYLDLHRARAEILRLQAEIDALMATPLESKTETQQQPDNSSCDPALSPQIQLKIVSLELTQGQLKLKMTEKQRQLTSQRIIPLELLESILAHAHFSFGIPLLTLALVCQEWRLTVLSTPRLWSNVSVITACQLGGKKPVEWLRQRIERAKGAPLDVTLSATCSLGTCNRSGTVSKANMSFKVVKMLHKVVLESGTRTWRSLTILDGTRQSTLATVPTAPASTQANIERNEFRAWMTGKMKNAAFPNLRVLDMQAYTYVPHEDYFEDMYSAIRRTTVSLNSCFLAEEQLPAGFLKDSQLFRNLYELKAGNSIINQGIAPASLRCLHVPSIEFAPFDFSRITNLTLKTYSNTENIAFSALIHLAVECPSVSLFQNLNAPCLYSLSLGKVTPVVQRSQISFLARRNPFSKQLGPIIDLFRNASASIVVRPKALRLSEWLPVDSICRILERWPQLQDVSLTMNYTVYYIEKELEDLKKQFKIRDTVNEEAGIDVQATWKLCPNLQTLHFEGWAGVNMEAGEGNFSFQRSARDLLHSRRYSPLRRISWGSRNARNEQCVTR